MEEPMQMIIRLCTLVLQYPDSCTYLPYKRCHVPLDTEAKPSVHIILASEYMPLLLLFI